MIHAATQPVAVAMGLKAALNALAPSEAMAQNSPVHPSFPTSSLKLIMSEIGPIFA